MSQSQNIKSEILETDTSNNTIDPSKRTHNISTTTSPTEFKRSPYIPFWSENPNVLFQQKYIFEFFPIDSMTYEQKLNSVTRTVILLTIIGFMLSRSIRLLCISAITIGSIFLLYYYHQKERDKSFSKKLGQEIKENFEGPAMQYLKNNNLPIPTDLFTQPQSDNPFGNVLMTDYDYNPNKKPAPPSFNQNISTDILKQAKQLVSDQNPDQPDISDKLFQDLGDNLVFEQSMRQFNSNPSTTIPNDQGAFAEFCYGSMVSCKEGNAFACARNLSRYTN